MAYIKVLDTNYTGFATGKAEGTIAVVPAKRYSGILCWSRIQDVWAVVMVSGDYEYYSGTIDYEKTWKLVSIFKEKESAISYADNLEVYNV